MSLKLYAGLAGLALAAALPAQTLVDEPPPPELAALVGSATAAAEAGGRGAYKAEMVSDPGLLTHTIYRPKTLPAGKLPIVSWANGACTNIGNRFRYFLTDVASHGFLILAIGPKGPQVAEWKINISGRNGAPPPGTPAPSQASQMIDAINWAIAENGRKASPYYHRLNVKKIAVAGQSCGGLQAISSGSDPRVSTVMVMNSGTFPVGARVLEGTGNATKASLKALHTPVAYFSGDESDVAWKNANADFDAITHIPVFRAWKHGIGHAEHYRQVHGGDFSSVTAAWLEWQLKGDSVAAKNFVGKECGLCRDQNWVVSRKGIK